MEKRKYVFGTHGSVAEEWLLHKKCSEWWYTTGTLYAENGDMYGFQYTLVKNRVFGIEMWLAMEALTDLQTGKHYYNQTFLKGNQKPKITVDSVCANGSVLVRDEKGFDLHLAAKGYSVTVRMDAVKEPVWHCEDGFLRMGIPDSPRDTTFYYSYTNLALKGTLCLDGQEIPVTGQGWFDKQGGPFRVTALETHWEWFSLRFLDGEEIMLFSFPQDDYRDGTYVRRDGSYERMNRYCIEPLDFTVANDIRFSCKWQLHMPGIKDEAYTIVPLADGQINLAYFELLAGIYDRDGKLQGHCFVELLPGVYNKKIPIALTKTV
jgi:predicted secreted hydrolase